jgi:CobQ-like glutamine amidotransferase family enzyme
MQVTVAHLYPDYLNIYADRGNIAVLERRARWRGIGFTLVAVGIGDALPEGADLVYVGGGQDRERRSSPSVAATSCWAARISTAPGFSSPASASSRTRPWRVSGG